jgi:hypothetical protein
MNSNYSVERMAADSGVWCPPPSLTSAFARTMNHRVVLFHLREAAEELNRMVEELSQDSRYTEESLEVAMGHMYHHLNSAWNGRNQTSKQHRECTDSDFNRFRKFPKEQEFLYLDVTLEGEPAAQPNRHPARRRPTRRSPKGGGR